MRGEQARYAMERKELTVEGYMTESQGKGLLEASDKMRHLAAVDCKLFGIFFI